MSALGEPLLLGRCRVQFDAASAEGGGKNARQSSLPNIRAKDRPSLVRRVG